MSEGEHRLLVGLVSEFETVRKKRVQWENRDIFVVKAKDRFYALDSFCYHAGGPLYKGDIEELGGRMCMVCPWHRYNVCLDTGQNYYKALDPRDMKKPGVWTAGEVRQRTHPVTVTEGKVYVNITPRDGTLDSDHYNTKDKDTE